MLIFWLADFFRKALLSVVMIFARGKAWLQLVTFFYTCQAMIAIGSFTNARNCSFDRRMDIFNEIKLILILYHMMTFSELGPNEKLKFELGFSCTTMLLLGLCVNLTMLIVHPVQVCRFKLKVCLSKGKSKELLTFRRESLRAMAGMFHERRTVQLKLHA